ncbi:MAG: methyltransferase [Gammaproteobacteria bacterium]|nr:methyltransferase [Gammaproteobacteria bacterium]
MKKNLLFLSLIVWCSWASVRADQDQVDRDQAWRNVLYSDHRTPANITRDRYRHPADTIEFFEVKPDMKVVEVWPGGGWYTEILAIYLRDKGELYAAHFAEDSEISYFRSSYNRFFRKASKRIDVYGKVRITELEPPKKLALAPAGTVDRVLTFRNVHNWMKSGHVDLVFKSMFDALKPGGILGVVEHRAANDKPQDPEAKSGYVREDYVIGLAEKAGFKLLATSEINANPKDTKNYPAGVWTLPPTLRLKDKNKDTYLAIGESDRMTLKFVKPLNSNIVDGQNKDVSKNGSEKSQEDG